MIEVNIVIKINDTVLNLALDEAKELCETLKDLTDSNTNSQFVPLQPLYPPKIDPWQPWKPLCTYSTGCTQQGEPRVIKKERIHTDDLCNN